MITWKSVPYGVRLAYYILRHLDIFFAKFKVVINIIINDVQCLFNVLLTSSIVICYNISKLTYLMY